MFLINKAELDWSLFLGSSPSAPLPHRPYVISFGLEPHKENGEVEAINHLESLVKAGATAASGEEGEGRAGLAGMGRDGLGETQRHGHGAGSCGQNPERRLIFSLNISLCLPVDVPPAVCPTAPPCLLPFEGKRLPHSHCKPRTSLLARTRSALLPSGF